MADLKINSRDWLVFIKGIGDSSFLPVACLTSNSLESTSSPVDASSKCGNQMLPNPKIEQKVSIEGFTITQSGTPSQVSTSRLYQLFTDQEVFDVRICKAVSGPQDSVYSGSAFVSSLTETADDGDYNKFTGELTVSVPPLIESPAY